MRVNQYNAMRMFQLSISLLQISKNKTKSNKEWSKM